MSEADGVTVVVPCRNEAGSLPDVLAAMPPGYVPLVVDNGSDDGTASVASEHGAEVVVEPTPGYGAAVQAGVEAARTSIVCVIDGDGSMDPGELPGSWIWSSQAPIWPLAAGTRSDTPVGPSMPVSAMPPSPPGCVGHSESTSMTSAPSGPCAPTLCWRWESRTADRVTPWSSWFVPDGRSSASRNAP